VDLVDQVIEVSDNGWRYADSDICVFQQGPLQESMPTPVRGGECSDILEYISLSKEEHQILLRAFIPSRMFPHVSPPHLLIMGEWGWGKSGIAEIAKRLLDPQRDRNDLHGRPVDPRSWITSLASEYLHVADNVNDPLDKKYTEILSRACDGLAHKERKYFTNFGTSSVSFMRGVIITGTVMPFDKPDLLSRSLLVYLEEPIKNRMDEEVLKQKFESARPKLFGSILQIASEALRILPSVTPISNDVIRLGDWARYATACAMAQGISRKQFLEVLSSVKAKQIQCRSESKPLFKAILHLMANRSVWQGTSSDLLCQLEPLARRERLIGKEWPSNAIWCGRQLRDMREELRANDIEIEDFKKGHVGERWNRISKIQKMQLLLGGQK
jgi:hypothetical protein